MTTNAKKSPTNAKKSLSAATQDGWTDLPCGGRVLMRDGRPVRVSDGGNDCIADKHVVGDLAVLGWTVSVGEWSVGDEQDATAPVEVTL